jgi:hypothetical protein
MLVAWTGVVVVVVGGTVAVVGGTVVVVVVVDPDPPPMATSRFDMSMSPGVSTTSIGTVKSPPTVGVPVTTPLALRLRPGGRLPLFTNQA